MAFASREAPHGRCKETLKEGAAFMGAQCTEMRGTSRGVTLMSLSKEEVTNSEGLWWANLRTLMCSRCRSCTKAAGGDQHTQHGGRGGEPESRRCRASWL
jgi:hypothetical protein